jgi:hypothetical protein
MRPVIESTKARELADSELQIMEEAHELAELVLERHSGDFSQAAEELWPYEIAQTALRSLVYEIRYRPVQACEAMKLMQEFIGTVHKNLEADITEAWRLEREAKRMLFTCAGAGAELTLSSYRRTINTLREYLAQGKYMIRFWSKWEEPSHVLLWFHEALAVKRGRNSAVIGADSVHRLVHELQIPAISAKAK